MFLIRENMMKISNRKLSFWATTVSLIFLSPYVLSESIKFYLDDFNPIAYEDKGIKKGILVEWSKLIANKANLDYEVVLVPTPRVPLYLETGEADISIQVLSKRFIDIATPIAKLPAYRVGTFSLQKNPINSLEDLYGKQVCQIIAGSYGSEFDNDEKIQKYYVSTYDQIIQMVLKERCIVGIGFSDIMHHRALTMGLTRQDFAETYTVTDIAPVVVVNKRMNNKLVLLIQKAVQELSFKGAFDRTYQNYKDSIGDWSH